MSCKKYFLTFLLFVTPIVIWALIFYPQNNDITRLGKKSQIVYVSDTEATKPSLRSFLADTIQIPTNLRWYGICFYNNTPPGPNWDSNHGKPVSDMQVAFTIGDPNKYSKSDLQKLYFIDLGSEFGNVYTIKYGNKGCFKYSGTDGFSYRIAAIVDGGLQGEFKYRIISKPALITLLPKLFVIFTLWLVIMQSIFWAIKEIKK